MYFGSTAHPENSTSSNTIASIKHRKQNNALARSRKFERSPYLLLWKCCFWKKIAFKCTIIAICCILFPFPKNTWFSTNHVKRVLWLNKTWDDIKFLLNSIWNIRLKILTLPKKSSLNVVIAYEIFWRLIQKKTFL